MATRGRSPTPPGLLLLTLFLLTTASPPPRYLPTLTRVATYEDIPSSFASIYQAAPICPDTLTFSTPTIDERLVALLPLPSITQDGSTCAGPTSSPPPLSLVSEATVEQPGLLTALNLAPFRAALDANPNAQSLITSSNTTSMLVAHHPTDRVCGDSTFPPSTIYFIIRETDPFRISFNRSNTLELVTLPPQLKALLIVAQNSAVCLLVDRGSNPTADATITTTSPDGETVTTPLTPAGQSPAPLPSMVPSITPVVSPSPVPGAESGDGSSGGAGSVVGPVATPAASVGMESGSQGNEEVGETMEPEESVEAEESMEVVMGDGGSVGGESGVIGEEGEEGVIEETAVETADGSEVMPFEGEVDDGSACFPAEAEVVLESGEVRRMEQVAIGDRVRSGEGGAVSDVMLFTHRERWGWYRFVRFELECGKVLEVSRGHYVYVAEGGMKKAGDVRRGEQMVVEGGRGGRVVRVGSVVRRGLFNPQTVGGVVMVNGVRVSTYTTAVEPRLAHGPLLAPVRFLYAWLGGWGVGVVEWAVEGGASGVVGWMPRGESWVGA